MQRWRSGVTMLGMNPWVIATPAAVVLAATGIAAYGGAYPRSQLFGRTVWHTGSPRKLAITFDDGPNPAITPRLLDLLDRFRAHATFFLIGGFARDCPELVREISARGHIVGNHTETHANLFWQREPKIFAEMRLCHTGLTQILGVAPKWFRPPFGLRNPWVAGVARELNLRTAMWTLLPGDWRAPNPEWLVRRMNPIAERARKAHQTLLAQAGGGDRGDILCLHDGDHRTQNGDRTSTLAALEYWLPRWADLGLEFVTIDEAGAAPA